MSFGRFLQLAGLIIVTWVMVRSFVSEPTMLFQFGGLAAGAAVFLAGRAVEARAK
jgi:hypothetical protein